MVCKIYTLRSAKLDQIIRQMNHDCFVFFIFYIYTK